MWLKRMFGVSTGCIVFVVFELGVVVEGMGAIQDAYRDVVQEQEIRLVFTPGVWRASRVIGMPVHDAEGKRIGEIFDVVLTQDRLRVAYAVVSYGDASSGTQQIPVPWRILRQGVDRGALEITIDEGRLANAPELGQRLLWPLDMSESWPEKVRHGGALMSDDERITGRISSERLWTYRLSQFPGLNIKNAKEEDLGEIEEVFIDMNQARPVFVLIGVGGVLGIGEDLAYVPWDLIHFDEAKDVGRVDIAPETLARLAQADEGDRIDLNVPADVRRLHRRFRIGRH